MELDVIISLVFIWNLYGFSMSICVNSLCEGFEIYKSQFQEFEPFFEEKTRVYVECCSLCASMDKCASFNYDVKTHKCSLMANASDALTDKRSTISGRYVKEHDQFLHHSNRVCRTRPCKPDQVCVEMTSGNGYICLHGLFKTKASTSNPTCEVAPPIEHMTLERSSSDSSQAQVTYTCDTGFRGTSGSGHSVCTEDGRWTRPSLVCEVVDCGPPPDSNLHDVSFMDTTYQSTAVYQCALGYYIPGNGTSVCQADGQWSLTCQLVDCGTPPDLNLHDVSFVNTNYLSTAEYQCGLGYYTPGNGTSVCQTDGQWSRACQIVDCGAPPVTEGMDVVSDGGTSYQSIVTYKCALGYNPNMTVMNRTCQADGTWSQTPSTCSIVDCGTPPDSNLHDISYMATKYMAKAVYQCGLGYTPYNVTSLCQADGQWSPTCEEIPNLTGTNVQPRSSTSLLKCRTVVSSPVNVPLDPDGADIVSARCASDEILTGCSALNTASQMRGSLLGKSFCRTRAVLGTQSVARCCKISGLQCEYIRGEVAASVSCYKNFQLLDCACWSKTLAEICYSTMTNNTCVQDSSAKVARSAVCCTHDSVICYVKEALGKEGPQSDEMTLTCGPGETMTSCSGFNKDKAIHKATIEDRGGVDTCVVLPGEGSYSTLKGYVSCCKVKS